MEKEDIALVAQLLAGMKDAADKLAEAQRKKDIEKVKTAKKEILYFQDQIAKLV